MTDFKSLMIPHDFSPHARAALEIGTQLAQKLDGNISLVHIIQPPAYAYGYPAPAGTGTAVALPNLLELQEQARKSLGEIAEEMAPPARVEVVEGNNISEALCQAADRLKADLIIMGTHGRTGLAHAFIGSVAERTLRSAPCPVLTVRGEESDR